MAFLREGYEEKLAKGGETENHKKCTGCCVSKGSPGNY